MDHNCSVHGALHVLGKRWIILTLFQFCGDPDKPVRFGEIQLALPDITPKVLSQSLKSIVDYGLVTKTIDATQIPIKTEYVLTEKGKDLIPVIEAMRAWSLAYNSCIHKNECTMCVF